MQDASANPDGGYWSSWCCAGVVGDTLNRGSPLYNWAEDFVICPPLGDCVVLAAILLRNEGDQNLVGGAECECLRVAKLDIILVEGNVFQYEDFGLS
jgi:hypothetical protein